MKSFIAPILLSALTIFPLYAEEKKESVIELPEAKAFIEEMSKKHQLAQPTLERWFSGAHINPKVLANISKPYEALPWHRYRALFVTDKHVQDGLDFWQKNQKTLEKAEKEFGVPAEIIVAIIGVETRYGKHKGFYPILDALSTLAFKYPPRAKFFKSELEQLLLLANEQNLDPTQMVSSYAGAMGIPQFISSSYRAYAVDFSGSGQADLINSTEDAIGSVANYFKKHGWAPNEPVAWPVKAKTSKVKDLEFSSSNPKPKYTAQELKNYGVEWIADKKHNADKMALLAFEHKEGPEYWVGLQNFYVITRYNHSHHYGMAVYQLSQKLKEAEQAQKKNTASKVG